jgi:malate/lactate dehydrogenase
MKKAGVIGGSGFIESDVISLLLNTNYDVKVSTIDISKKENYEHLMDLNFSENLYVCEIDSEEKSALHNFTKDCDIVIFINPLDMNF